MGDYRAIAAKCIRKRGEPFGGYDTPEVASENFDTDEDFAEAIKQHILQILEDDREEEE